MPNDYPGWQHYYPPDSSDPGVLREYDEELAIAEFEAEEADPSQRERWDRYFIEYAAPAMLVVGTLLVAYAAWHSYAVRTW